MSLSALNWERNCSCEEKEIVTYWTSWDISVPLGVPCFLLGCSFSLSLIPVNCTMIFLPPVELQKWYYFRSNHSMWVSKNSKFVWSENKRSNRMNVYQKGKTYRPLILVLSFWSDLYLNMALGSNNLLIFRIKHFMQFWSGDATEFWGGGPGRITRGRASMTEKAGHSGVSCSRQWGTQKHSYRSRELVVPGRSCVGWGNH